MAATEEGAESSAAGEREHVSFARGGPVFVPFMVGPISTAPGFMHSALQELQSLEAELGDPGDEFDGELCIDELRVLTQEELVEHALQEAMEDDSNSSTPPQPEEQTCDEGMSANPTPRNEALTSSPSAERENSRLPIEDTAVISHEPESSNGKPRGKKAKTRCRKGKTGTITLDSSVERENHGSPVDMAIVPHEPEGSEGNGTATSNPSAENAVSESPVDLSIVPHDPEGTNGQTTCEKVKKRGRHFDREVRAKILQGSYLTKADKWVEIKAKQDEDKYAARLHSFSGDSVKSKCSKSSSDKIEMATSLKLTGVPWKNKASRPEEHRTVVHPEVILCVEIYQKKCGSVKCQELLVLGSQFLTDLRDNICCLTDKLMKVAGQHDHSGYFLIENSGDEVAEKWDAITSGVLKKRQKDLLRGLNISNVPEFKSERMQTTRFSDLHFRPGAGYLYCHQGSCNHRIVIRDMRLIHQDDSQDQADYPLQTFQLQKRLQKCSVCQIYPATKMTVDDKWALNNPCYFCIKCYYLLHYKEDNTLLYEHTVYDFIQE
uniref:snRNA-activating protein complex subunit n=1 Tax=Setaria viridis TaxID=4556 RepID=A0A4U6USQ4_SETVI|nr:hypothetical protein SEVIR_5G429900v2 [Setaria viridis]